MKVTISMNAKERKAITRLFDRSFDVAAKMTGEEKPEFELKESYDMPGFSASLPKDGEQISFEIHPGIVTSICKWATKFSVRFIEFITSVIHDCEDMEEEAEEIGQDIRDEYKKTHPEYGCEPFFRHDEPTESDATEPSEDDDGVIHQHFSVPSDSVNQVEQPEE